MANTLDNFRKAEEELEHLAEEKSQLDLEEKVVRCAIISTAL
ncbi:DNA repair protein RAD50-like protein [Corchorus olitorius]|uniref:DNA repair protein RAD50-like protein n=1 Tax=Corchorus olitorius TaxID=93759 RepID=A0A1R3J139_9ROSI|nr:DNA repair protein RAD50-like protein [Corchorus olitorius]